MKTVGNKKEVYEGQALHTTGGLEKEDLTINPRTGKVASLKQLKRTPPGSGIKSAKFQGGVVKASLGGGNLPSDIDKTPGAHVFSLAKHASPNEWKILLKMASPGLVRGIKSGLLTINPDKIPKKHMSNVKKLLDEKSTRQDHSDALTGSGGFGDFLKDTLPTIASVALPLLL